MILFPVGANPKWRPVAILENVEWPHFCNGSCNSLRIWFYGSIFWSVDRMALHPLDQIQDRGRQPSYIIYSGHISETVHPIQFVLDSRVNV